MKMWEKEKKQRAYQLDDSKGDRHELRSWCNVLSGQIPNGHQSKIIYVFVLAGSPLGNGNLGMLVHDYATYK